MAMLTIRGRDEHLKQRLRVRAARSGRSILRDALADSDEQRGLGSRIHARVLEVSGGAELPLPPRSAPRPAPDFANDPR